MAESARNVVVVGGSAAGLRCACRLARLQPDWRVRIVEAREVFAYSACGLPYVLSGDLESLAVLRRTDYMAVRDEVYFAAYKGVEVLAGHRALELDLETRTLRVEGPGGGGELPWDDLVLATGAVPLRLSGQSEHPRILTFHTWDDVNPLKQQLAGGELERVAIIGAGPTGCELAEAFRSLWGAEVTLIEGAETPLPGLVDAEIGALVAGHLESQGVRVLCGSPVEAIEGGDEGATVRVGGTTVEVDAVVVAIGVRPTVELARRAGIELGAAGAIAVDDRMATSMPHVWAIGDCAEVRDAVTGEKAWMPLGSLGNRQGRTLANILAGREDVIPPAAGAAVVKVFDLTVVATGRTEAASLERGVRARSSWITTFDRAHFWPGSQEIHVKLVYDAGSRRVLGMQAASQGEVVRGVDVATQLILRRATLEDFSRIEHAHAPPFAPPIDPLAVAAFAAQNQEDGLEAIVPRSGLDETVVLDVRTREDAEQDPVAAARVANIPLGELRGRLDEVDSATRVVTCGRGTRSAEAARLLRRQGLPVRYLGGGLRWRGAMGKRSRS